MKRSIITLAASAFLLSACVISVQDDYDDQRLSQHGSWSELEQSNRELIGQLDMGASIQSVRSKLGVPDFDELLKQEGSQYRILFYRTQRKSGDGATTKDECTPIVFENEQLIGFGESALDIIRV